MASWSRDFCDSRPTILNCGGELVEAVGGEVGDQIDGERLQDRQDDPDLLQLVRRQGLDPEPAPYLRLQGALPGEADQGLANRSPADAELPGNLGVPDTGSGRQGAALNLLEQIEIDLVSQRRSGEHGLAPVAAM